MLHAASESPVHAVSRHRPIGAQAPQTSRAPGSSFADVLDETQAATAQAQIQADDARAAQTDDSQPTAKSADGKPADSKSADSKAAKSDTTKASQDGKTVAKTDNTDQAQQPDKTAKTDKTVDVKTAAEIKVVKSAASQDSEPVDPKTKDNTDQNAAPQAAAQAIAPAPVVKAPDAAATLVPVSVATPTVPDGDTDTPPSLDAQALQAAASGKPESTLAGKTAATAQAEAKLQGPAAEAADHAIAHARGETADQPTLQAASFDTLATNAAADAPKADANFAQSGALPAPAQTAAAAPTAAAASAAQQAPQAAAVPLAGVAVEIAGKAAAGKNHFEIRLDPPELGRIEVHLAVDHDGNVTSRLIADRSDTLDLLRRDAGGLERALQDAGLKTSDNGLQFSLRDQSAYQQQQQQKGLAGSDVNRILVEDDTVAAKIAPQNYGRLAGLGGGLDIQV